MNEQKNQLELESSIRLDERMRTLRSVIGLVDAYRVTPPPAGTEKIVDDASRAAAEDILSDLRDLLDADERRADDGDP